VENGEAFYTYRPTGPAEMIRRPIGTSLFEADKPSALSALRIAADIPFVRRNIVLTVVPGNRFL
jgi:hypothetical protein